MTGTSEPPLYWISLDGQQVPLKALMPELDEAFKTLYSALNQGARIDADEFDLRAAGFLRTTTDTMRHDNYFENFTPLWSRHLSAGQFPLAEAIWEWALRPVLAYE